MERQKGFVITEGKGFQMTFENGYTVSVQWGSMNYCENRHSEISQERLGELGSDTAECAYWKDGGEMLPFPHMAYYDTVKGYMTSDEVAKFLNWVAQKKG